MHAASASVEHLYFYFHIFNSQYMIPKKKKKKQKYNKQTNKQNTQIKYTNRIFIKYKKI